MDTSMYNILVGVIGGGKAKQLRDRLEQEGITLVKHHDRIDVRIRAKGFEAPLSVGLYRQDAKVWGFPCGKYMVIIRELPGRSPWAWEAWEMYGTTAAKRQASGLNYETIELAVGQGMAYAKGEIA